jgi:hypothetical protein
MRARSETRGRWSQRYISSVGNACFSKSIPAWVTWVTLTSSSESLLSLFRCARPASVTRVLIEAEEGELVSPFSCSSPASVTWVTLGLRKVSSVNQRPTKANGSGKDRQRAEYVGSVDRHNLGAARCFGLKSRLRLPQIAPVSRQNAYARILRLVSSNKVAHRLSSAHASPCSPSPSGIHSECLVIFFAECRHGGKETRRKRGAIGIHF